MRPSRILFVALLLSMLLVAPVLAFQVDPAEPLDMGWQYFAALLLNSFVIVAAVRLLTYFFPYFRARIPWALPMLAIVAGPLMIMVTEAVSGALGYPVDFAPIAGVFVGGSAVALHQVKVQVAKVRPKKVR